MKDLLRAIYTAPNEYLKRHHLTRFIIYLILTLLALTISTLYAIAGDVLASVAVCAPCAFGFICLWETWPSLKRPRK